MVDDAIREYYELSKTVAKKPVKKTWQIDKNRFKYILKEK
jgi:hypothetical protein